jgi:arylformamidase
MLNINNFSIMTKCIDISQTIADNNGSVWPGHPEIVREEITGATGTSTITKLTLGSHTGTHVDAQKHVMRNGKGLETIPLENFIGECRVLDISQERYSIKTSHLIDKNIRSGERILLKTYNSIRGYERFYDDYVFIDSQAAIYLSDLNIKLIGIDALSVIDYVKLKETKILDNIPHTAFLDKNIPILEGLDLSQTTEGKYFLSALPLKLEQIDGSPVRAVLVC